MKKITMQLLADQLELSRVTVWKVLNNKPGVSPDTTKKVLDAVEKLNEEDTGISPEKKATANFPKSITVVAARADSSYFWMRILDQIVSELNQHGIAFNYLPTNVMKLSAAGVEEFLNPKRTDGFMVINIYDKALIDVLRASPLPKVFLDTAPQYDPMDLHGDLITLEGEKSVAQMVESLIGRGCKRLGFLGDIHYAKTNLLRYRGFEKAMRENGLPILEKDCLKGPFDVEVQDHRVALLDFLKGLDTLPDAFVCASDFIAFNVQSLLTNPNNALRNDVLLSGHDDSKEFLLADRSIPTVHVQNGVLGKRIVNQLLFRCANPYCDYSEIRIYSKVVIR